MYDQEFTKALAFMDAENCEFCDGVSAGRINNKHACKKCLKTYEFKQELIELTSFTDISISNVLLSKNRTSKHKPWTWAKEPAEQHLLKAARHILTHLNIEAGGQKPSQDENHLDNAITRLSMAIAIKARK